MARMLTVPAVFEWLMIRKKLWRFDAAGVEDAERAERKSGTACSCAKPVVERNVTRNA